MICPVSGASNRTWAEPAESRLAGPNPAVAGAHRSDSPERARCFHCGEVCGDSTVARGEMAFCCQGCLAVHQVLAEAGLDHFYELNRHPGVRVRRSQEPAPEQWTCLDEPSVQQRLLDFTDEKTSRVTFRIPAIHCVACVWLLENLFQLHPGIGRSQVNYTRREVTLDFDPASLRLSGVAALLASIGYEPALTLGTLDKQATDPTRRRRWIQLGIAGFAFGNIMLFSLPAYFGLDSGSGPLLRSMFGYLSLALALPVLVYSASDYWKSAFLSFRRRALTLDVPIALGLAALYGQSLYEVLAGRGVGYLDSLAGLVFFLLCGRAFQRKTHERLAFDRDYKSFFPLSVMRRTSSGSESAAISAVRVGDRILLRNGELVPADARLVQGPALIDYSFVTGESEPAAKENGDYLYAGGRQVGAGIEVEIVKPVSQSYLTSLWNHEAFRKNSCDTLNTLTNLYSRRFTWIVAAIALGAAAFWMASGDPARGLKAFISVLIVACPCALALAAPFALGTAQRWLARAGVFLRNTLVLERLARVDAIVFDKTGTLTAPNTSLGSFRGEPLGADEEKLVCSLAQHSTHPYSRRIHESLRNGHALESLSSFAETPGLGIEACIRGREVWLGSRTWFESRGVHVEADSSAGRAPADGDSGVCLAFDRKFRGAFSFATEIRPETGRLLNDLARRFEISLLSGDNARERDRFRGMFGRDMELHFNQSPLDKLGYIRRLQESGRTVMMVGDGLNDAGALKQSDVGVAVVESVGAFSPASDVILDAARVPELPEFLKLARRSVRIVRVCFGISAAYNLVGVGIAAAGVLSPMICAVLMPVSSVSVVLAACGAATWAARRGGWLTRGGPR